MKLDANPTWMFAIYRGLNKPLLEVLHSCSIISVESKRMKYTLSICFQRDIKFIPNGYYDFTNSDMVDYSEKENTILFAGPVEDSFLPYLNSYFKDRPDLKHRIKLSGNHNKEELKEPFRKAKVFCLTSPSEACAHVFSEAIYNGCYLICTDVDGAIDITDYGRYGQLYPVGDIDALAKSLLETCTNETLLENNCLRSQQYALENLTWIKICSTLNNYLNDCD